MHVGGRPTCGFTACRPSLGAGNLRERPEGIIGISVPNMPMGSPGMEGAYKEDYQVVVFDAKGKIFLYEMR